MTPPRNEWGGVVVDENGMDALSHSKTDGFSGDDPIFVLETDRQTWIAVRGADGEGKETRFRLGFTSLHRAVEFAQAHPELPARRVRELRLEDLSSNDDLPLAIDIDPGAV